MPIEERLIRSVVGIKFGDLDYRDLEQQVGDRYPAKDVQEILWPTTTAHALDDEQRATADKPQINRRHPQRNMGPPELHQRPRPVLCVPKFSGPVDRALESNRS